MDQSLSDLISSDSLIPIEKAAMLPRIARMSGKDRAEYVLLVRRQIRAGLVRLSSDPRHAADVGVVRKGDAAAGGENVRQREVWMGQELSEAACRPPKPIFGASPAALARLESSDDRPLRTCTRDAANFFHQLAAPAWLQPFLSRPQVRVAEPVE